MHAFKGPVLKHPTLNIESVREQAANAQPPTSNIQRPTLNEKGPAGGRRSNPHSLVRIVMPSEVEASLDFSWRRTK